LSSIKPEKEFLRELARRACRRFDLSRVYFAEVLGRRRHFLAGAGEETFLAPESAPLSEKLVVFWEGELKNQEEFLEFLRQEITGQAPRPER